MSSSHLKDFISQLPSNPGVYKYFDAEENIIYIGKAKNLKKRVSSYFNKQQFENRKTAVMVGRIRRIEYTLVESEYDALLLENTLIKEYQPRYNINLKDDKSYPFIRITKERFPKVFAMRNPVKDGSEYFGPYSSVRVMHIVLDLIKKLYPIRNCNLNLSEENIRSNKFKVCLEYQIGNCKGPCVGLQLEEEYNEQINQIRYLLKGNLNLIRDALKKKIADAVEKLAFEEAHLLKIKLDAVESYQAKSTVVNPAIDNVEVMTISVESQRGFVNYLRVSNGMIVQTRNIELRKKMDETDEDLLLTALADIRNQGNPPSGELILPIEPQWKLADTKVFVPQRGDKKSLLDLSYKNALFFRKERLSMEEKTDPSLKTERVLETLRKDLRLKEAPHHMECFDNSNLQGTNPVSACVVFRDAKPAKSEYRIFNVKTVEGPNDFASMYEALSRRYKRMLEEGKPLPQVIIIDGGKGQLSASVQALKDLNLYGKIAILGIAKRLEEIYFPEDPMPLYLNKKSESLRIIQQMRDEAHRFGIKHHRNKRSKTAITNELENIAGIGEKTAHALLTHFKSVKKIKEASLEELSSVVGSKKAILIATYFETLY
jgi:excinuclease ABC subunit C